jgi:hypothetical protein
MADSCRWAGWAGCVGHASCGDKCRHVEMSADRYTLPAEKCLLAVRGWARQSRCAMSRCQSNMILCTSKQCTACCCNISFDAFLCLQLTHAADNASAIATLSASTAAANGTVSPQVRDVCRNGPCKRETAWCLAQRRADAPAL